MKYALSIESEMNVVATLARAWISAVWRRQLRTNRTINLRPTITLTPLATLLIVSLACADDWPQWRGANRDGVWEEEGLVERFDRERLEPVWSVEIGSGYSGPTVADDRVLLPTDLSSRSRSSACIALTR